MPPKFDLSDPAISELVTLFKSIGLSETKSIEAVRNPKTAATLKEIVVANDLTANPLEDKQAGLIASLATQGSKLPEAERNYVARAVADGRLKTTDQLSGKPIIDNGVSAHRLQFEAAIKYMESHPALPDDAEFNQECGVGTSPSVLHTPSSVIYCTY
jgi:glutaminyl-tRNA synthetase